MDQEVEQMVVSLPCIRDMPGSNLAQDAGYSDIFLCFLSPRGRYRDSISHYATTASFRLFSSLLHSNHLNIDAVYDE
jgi:hypothetical protein